MLKLISIGCALVALTATPAAAVTVNWADLTQQSTNSVVGTIAVGSGVTVTYSGSYGFAQTNGGGINYWTQGNPQPYTGGAVSNSPTGTDIIAFNQGGSKTITFSETVSDVYLALVSWNGNAGTFDQPFEIISQGCGYWGCGTFGSVTPTSFTGLGELHGIIRFTGSFNQVSFTDLTENWHGVQIGIAGLAPPNGGIPEPASWALLIGGFGLAGVALRSRRGALAAA